MEGYAIAELLRRSAERWGVAPAFLAPGRAPLSYTGLLKQAEETAERLRELGIRRHDRIAMVLPNGPEMASAFVSIAAATGCAPLNPHYKQQDFVFYLGDLRAKALIVAGGSRSAAVQAAERIGVRVLQLRKDADEAAGVFRLEGSGVAAARDETWAGRDDVALLLHTSGTTSRPKLVPLLGWNLCASASNIAQTLELKPDDRCLNIMPLFHIHGLVAAVLATLQAGASVVCTDGVYATRFFEWMEEYLPTWYTAVPTVHQRLLIRAKDRREVVDGCRLRFIRSSSAALAPQVLTELEAAFGAPVIEAYGMTEAAHQMTSNPLPPGKRKPGSVGPAAGPEVAIMDEVGCLLPARATGEVVIRGANVTPGYEANEAANRMAFIDGWFRTGDQGWMDEDGYLYLTGRLKELINRGGQKISPREVDEVLSQHPAVGQALTFAVPHAQLGEEVAAAVELKSAGAADERELRRYAAERLATFKTPRVIRIVEEIPRGPTGKLQRFGLAELLGIRMPDDHVAAEEHIEPRTELEQRIAALWRQMLQVERVGVKDKFEVLGGDSLLTVRMLAVVSEMEGADLPFLQFLEEGTVEAIAAEIEEWRSGPRADKGLVAIQPKGGRGPLFCVPGHDGVLAGISRLAHLLGAEQPVWAFALEEYDEAGSVEETATRFLALMRSRQSQGPYRLAGVCFGGLVAYEMARRLEREEENVELLALIDSLNPGWRRSQGPKGVAAAMLRQWKSKAAYHRGTLSRMDAGDAVRYVAQRVGAFFENHGETIGAWLMRAGISLPWKVGRMKRTYRRAMLTYTPRDYGGRVLLIKVRGRRLDAPFLGWKEVVLGGVEEVEIPLHPNGALAGANVQRVAAILSERLR